MTAAEIAERDLKARERRDKKQRAATPEHVPEEAEEISSPIYGAGEIGRRRRRGWKQEEGDNDRGR